MSWELVLRHCAAIDASIETARVQLDLTAAQVAGLKAYAKAGCAKDTATQSLPDHCTGIAENDCGLQSEDARVARTSLTHPNAWYCRGCRVLSSNGVTIDP